MFADGFVDLSQHVVAQLAPGDVVQHDRVIGEQLSGRGGKHDGELDPGRHIANHARTGVEHVAGDVRVSGECIIQIRP